MIEDVSWLKVLAPIHKGQSRNALIAIRAKIKNARNNLRQRGEVPSEELLEQLLFESYGKECRTCVLMKRRKPYIITAYPSDYRHNKSVANYDHKDPNGGNSESNLQLLCRNCNIIKGNTTNQDFEELCRQMAEMPPDIAHKIRIGLYRKPIYREKWCRESGKLKHPIKSIEPLRGIHSKRHE